MIVVSDTGPLRYLLEAGAIQALPRLYGKVLAPPAVMRELLFPHFPPAVRQWAQHPPDWLTIEQPQRVDFLGELDEGEAAALSLARERAADLLLIDERKGTELARRIGLEVRGTLAVIAAAAAHADIDFEQSIHVLTTQTMFRFTPELIEDARQLYMRLRSDSGKLR